MFMGSAIISSIRRLFRDRQRDQAWGWSRQHYEAQLQDAACEVAYWIYVLLDYPYSAFVPASRVKEDLSLDWLEMLQVSLALKEKRGIRLTQEETAQCQTIDDLVLLANARMMAT
jgi:hypothetical protein